MDLNPPNPIQSVLSIPIYHSLLIPITKTNLINYAISEAQVAEKWPSLLLLLQGNSWYLKLRETNHDRPTEDWTAITLQY